MKKWILLVSVALLCMTEIVEAQDVKNNKLGVTLDLTYMSKYMSKGEEDYGQQGGFFETLDLDLWGTGFGTSVSHREATASGYVNSEKIYYSLYYGNAAFKDSWFAMKYKLGWTYKYYPSNARHVKDKQEWWYELSWPKLLPWDLTFCYNGYYETPAGRHYDNRAKAGWHHSFGLKRKFDIADLPPVTASAFMDYRDGLGGPSKDHDWSHATFGLSTNIKLTSNLSFSPGIYHQITMDKSICGRKDVTYCKLSMKYKF
jgi:hypothetical protein